MKNMTEWLFPGERMAECEAERLAEKGRAMASDWKAAFRTAWKGCGPAVPVAIVDRPVKVAKEPKAPKGPGKREAKRLAAEQAKAAESAKWAGWADGYCRLVPSAVMAEGGGE